MQTTSHKTKSERVHITTVCGMNLLRLKSWLPDNEGGGKPVLLEQLELPSLVGATVSGILRVLCLGPGDWMVVSHDQEAATLSQRIRPDLCQRGFILVDLSDGLAVLEVSGSAIRDVLSKGCGLDFHPRNFPAGWCARTRFAQIPLTIECLDESPRFQLYATRSYLHYLLDWFSDASVEFE